MSKQLLSGNEAIAQGAWEAGVAVGAAYPGTPSTETLENLVRKPDVYCEWAPNEKVAFEVGLGAAMGGVRTLVTMKHVGVNVAADPFMSAANTGVNAGLVLLAADDPSCYSSQNEQDSRHYAAFGRIPCLDPSDSQEAYEMTQQAFDVSEQFDTVVMLHETMRIAHTKTLVDVVGSRTDVEVRAYESRPEKFVMMPANAVRRTLVCNDREDELVAWAEETPLNRVEMRDTKVGIICAGALYVHVREALPDASVFKLGVTWPLPPKKLAAFASLVDKVYVVEEANPYLEMRVRAMGIDVAEPPAGRLPRSGEITPAHIRAAFGIADPAHLAAAEGLPPRPPAFCAGCPHRLVYVELKRIKAIVTGDIGCYTLGAVVVGVIGDSTFAHSGITSLLGTVYNGGKGTLCILDNRTTAMTGTQGNPVNGVTLTDQAARVNPLDVPAGKQLDLVKLCEAIGVDEVEVVDAQDMLAIRRALKEATSHTDKLSVIIFKAPCRLIDRSRKPTPTITDCRRCGRCIQIGCPALGRDETGHAVIDPNQCIGCGQCAQACPFGCISKEA